MAIKNRVKVHSKGGENPELKLDSGPLPMPDPMSDPEHYEVDVPVTLEVPSDSTPHYKLSILWDHWSPQVKAKAIFDVLAIQRLSVVNRVPFVVATDAELIPALRGIGVLSTDNFLRPHLTRVYLMNTEDIPSSLADRISDLDTELDFVNINMQRVEVPTGESEYTTDPYAGIIMPKFSQTIPETLPIDRPAPKRLNMFTRPR